MKYRLPIAIVVLCLGCQYSNGNDNDNDNDDPLGTVRQASVCGSTDWTSAGAPSGSDLSAAVALRRRDWVGLLKWKDLSGFKELTSIERSSDRAVCTATVVDPYHVLTAGHCVAQHSNWPHTSKNNRLLAVEAAPRYMVLRLGSYQDHVSKDLELDSVVEYSYLETDYALLRLKAPLKMSPWPKMRLDDLQQNEPLVVLQHPDGGSMMVAEGTVLESDRETIYHDVDTDNGSSGALLFDSAGDYVGIHVRGGCDANGGANVGMSTYSVAILSPAVACLEARLRARSLGWITDAELESKAYSNKAPRFFKDLRGQDAWIDAWVACNEIAEDLMQEIIAAYGHPPSPPDPPDAGGDESSQCKEMRDWACSNGLASAAECDKYSKNNWVPVFIHSNDRSAGIWGWGECHAVLAMPPQP